jgi:hypothetical protein
MGQVLVPALVAAVVTLGIEFFAKPSLEARKERITQGHRAERDVRRHFRLLSFHLGRLMSWTRKASADRLPEQIQSIERDMKAPLDQMIEAIAQSEEASEGLARDCLLQFGSACTAYLIMAEQSHLSQEAGDRMVQSVLSPLSDIADEAVHTSSWRLIRRKRIRSKLADLSNPGAGEAT